MLDRRLVEDVANTLRIDAGLVEKDWHVVRAIGILAALDHGGVKPAFSGGTSLSKAWDLIKRFSEDIDFKVAMPPAVSGAKARHERSAYRQQTLDALAAGGFGPVGKAVVGNQSRFFSADLAYPSEFDAGQGLRPHIRVEMSLQAPALSPIGRPIRSLIAAAQNLPPEVATFPCVDPIETAADKLSALAWRVCTRQRGAPGDDPTIIRHLHDLAALEQRVVGVPAFVSLVRQAAAADTGRGGAGAPADPAIRFAAMLERLRVDTLWAREYQDFVREVSFAGVSEVIGFHEALAAVAGLTEIFEAT